MSEQISIAIPVAAGRMVSIQWAYWFKMLAAPVPVGFQYLQGYPVDQARNLLVKAAQKDKSSHIFFLDDDVIPPPDALFQLWRHWKEKGLPIIAGLYGFRGNCAPGILIDTYDEDGKRICMPVRKEIAAEKGLLYHPEISTGLGCCLIDMQVFEHLKEPYFLAKDGMTGEDIYFFDGAKEAGFPLHIDRSIRCAHGHYGMVNHLGNMKGLVDENIIETWGERYSFMARK